MGRKCKHWSGGKTQLIEGMHQREREREREGKKEFEYRVEIDLMNEEEHTSS